MRSAAAIAFDCRPSRWLVAALAAIAVLALVSVLTSGLGPWPKTFAVAIVCALAGHAAWRLGRPSVVRCAWREGGDWVVRGSDGTERPAALVSARTLAGSIVIVLSSEPGAERIPIVLLPDNSDGDLRRRLRVRLAGRDGKGPTPR